MLKRVERRRVDAQSPIEKIRRKLGDKDYPRREAALVARVRLRGKADRLIRPTFGHTACRALGLLVEDFFAAAAADFSDYAALHAFRIQGKQLRYAMEIFAGAFDRAFRSELYPLVEQLQEKLGAINDHATARELFSNWLAEPNTGTEAQELPALIAAENAALDAARQEFFAWWTLDRAGELRRQFRELLGHAGRERTA